MRPRAAVAFLLLAAVMMAGCSKSEGGRDDDQDGLTNGQEASGWVVTIDFMDHRERRQAVSDATLADSDADGLDDVYEYALGSDPKAVDTDLDGLTDCQESFHTVRSACEDASFSGTADGGYKTNPARADSDAGGSRYTRDVLQFDDPTGTVPGGKPAWGDGVSDGDEVQGYSIALGSGRSVTVTSDPLRPDSDSDFLEDGAEAFQFSSDPTVPDTDGDGCRDGNDAVPGEAERFVPGLLRVTWREPGASGATTLRWIINLADTLIQTGGAHEVPPTDVQHGVETVVSPAQPAVRPRSCGVDAHDPWVPITVLAERPNGGGVRTVDLRTDNPGDATRIHWNPRTDRFRWDPNVAADLEGPMTFSGADGTVTFQPLVRLQGS